MDSLNPRSLSPSERFHALFESAIPNGRSSLSEPGMPRAAASPHQKELFDAGTKSRTTGTRPEDVAWVNFLDLYCERLRTRYASDYPNQVRRILERFTRYRGLCSAKLSEIQSTDIEAYLSERRSDRAPNGRPLSARTLNNEIATINACFAYAGPKDKLKGGRRHLNWLPEPAYCEKLPEPGLAPVELRDEQIQAFLRATSHARSPQIDGCTPQDFWVCVLLLDSLTLLRRKALLLVERPDDETLLVRKELFIPAAINKTNEDVIVTLGTDDTIAKLFAKLPTKPGEPLLPWKDSSGRRMTLGYFSDVIRDFQREAGIPDGSRLRLKHLRSTSANKVEDAFDESTAKSKLKHGPNTNTYRKHYRIRRPKEREIAATDSLTSWLFGVLKEAAKPDNPELRVIG